MSVLHGMRGVGGVCEMCMCLARGGVGGEGMRGLGLGFANPMGIGGVLDVYQCLGCGDVGGIGREYIGGLEQCLERWGGIISV